MNSFAIYTLSVRYFLPWSEKLAGTVVEKRIDPGSGMLVTQDPLIELGRPRLKIFQSGAGAVATVMEGGGEPMPLLLDLRKDPHWMALDGVPEAALAREDGHILVGGKQGIQLVNPDGTNKPFFKDFCGFLLQGPHDGCWTFERGLETAQFIDRAGNPMGTFPVSFRYEFVSDAEGRLCYCERGDSTIQCLQSDGQRIPQSGFELPAFANILSFTKGCLTYFHGSTLHLQLQDQAPRKISLLNAGLASDGRPFVAGYDQGKVLLQVGKSDPITIQVPGKYIHGLLPVVVVAVDEHYYWAKADGWGLLFDHKGDLVEAFQLTEQAYKDRLFPMTWTLSSISAFGKAPLLLACSGPTGIAVLELTVQ